MGAVNGRRIRGTSKVRSRTGDELQDTGRVKFYVCFYCHGKLKKNTGRRFRLQVDGPVWEAHKDHLVMPSEIPVEEEGKVLEE